MNVQPDQVSFAIYVGSGLNTSLDDVLAALKGSGITIGNFSGVGTSGGILPVLPPGPQLPPTLQWAFGLAVPFSKMKDTVAALTSLQQSIAQANNGLMLSFQVQGSSVSAALQQSQTCSIPDLLADARTQAQKLADAAGLSLGAILAMSSVAATQEANNVRSVAFVGLISTALLTTPQNCTATVKFGLTRF